MKQKENMDMGSVIKQFAQRSENKDASSAPDNVRLDYMLYRDGGEVATSARRIFGRLVLTWFKYLRREFGSHMK
jgi:hypothetical protein